jgi:hypothetical protein
MTQWQAVQPLSSACGEPDSVRRKTAAAASAEFSKHLARKQCVEKERPGIRNSLRSCREGRLGLNVQIHAAVSWTKTGCRCRIRTTGFPTCWKRGRGAVVQAAYDDCRWTGEGFFVPYDELHIKNGQTHRPVQAHAFWTNPMDALLCESETREFFYRQKSGAGSSFDRDAPDPAIAPRVSFAPKIRRRASPEKGMTAAVLSR